LFKIFGGLPSGRQAKVSVLTLLIGAINGKSFQLMPRRSKKKSPEKSGDRDRTPARLWAL